MIRSMTAFARMQAQSLIGEMVIQIRSVNHRFLEIGFRLPEQLKQWEGQLHAMAKSFLSRGKLEISISFISPLNQNPLEFDMHVVQNLYNALTNLKQQGFDFTKFSGLNLLKWPGVIKNSNPDGKILEKFLLEEFECALSQLIQMREAEGNKIKEILLQRVIDCEKQINTLAGKTQEIEKRLVDRIKDKILSWDLEVDSNRFEQELVYLLQKSDVQEEIDRLYVHLNEVKRILQKGGAIGRRLDFLLQELNREANTLGSKAVLIASTNVSIELKVLIEQMREQIQNIE